MLPVGGIRGLFFTFPITMVYFIEVFKLLSFFEKRLSTQDKAKNSSILVAYMLTFSFTVLLCVFVLYSSYKDALASIMLFYLPVITPLFWGIGYISGILIERICKKKDIRKSSSHL
jgi:hypothetical protein